MTVKTKLTVRERLHQLVDQLDEVTAEAVLVLLSYPAKNTQPESEKTGGDTTIRDDDPLWDLVDLIDESIDVPSDVSSDIDRYVADANESEWRT